MSTFVTVGNDKKPFHRLLEKVVNASSDLPQPVLIQRGHTPLETSECRVVDFLEMEDFQKEIDDAELVIMHAGAGSIIHAIRCGKVPLVMPRRVAHGEHVDDHQLELTEQFSETGKVLRLDQEASLREQAREALRRQREGQAHESSSLSREIGQLLHRLSSSS